MEGPFSINGEEVAVSFHPSDTLLTVLREHGYTEVKKGCGEGECGCCVVLLDGVPVNSCQVFAATVISKKITTVKGLGTIHAPHPIQAAFVEAGAVQCGFCVPGMICAAYALLEKNPDPDEMEIRRALDGNLCRCTGYVKIIAAVRLAARRMRESG